MIFAEISAFDPPVLIACVLGSLMFLLVGGNAAMDFWRNIKDKPTGAEVLEKARAEFQPKGDYITRHEYTQFRKNLEEKLTTLSTENQHILNAGQQRELHLASLIEALDSRIDELPARMVKEVTATIELVHKIQGKP